MADPALGKSVLQSLPNFNRTLLACQRAHMINSKGYWFGDNPFKYSVPVMIVEIAFVFIITRITYFLIRPFKQTVVIAQIIGGIIIGPSVLGRNDIYIKSLFPLQARHILRTFAEFGVMLHVFLIGVQIDMGLLRHVGKRAVIIGLSGTVVSFILGMATFSIIQHQTPFDDEVVVGIPPMLGSISVTSFIVVINLLNDLNMLNSELGRLASSISMVSNLLGSTFGIVTSFIGTSHLSTIKPVTIVISYLSYYGVMFFLLRPLIIWIANKTPEGKSMKESHFIIIICLVMGVGFIAEVIGQHASFGTFFLGMFLPDGPQLGTQLVNKLDIIASGVLLPIFCAMTGLRMNVSTLTKKGTAKLELMLVVCFLGKLVATILTSLFCDISFFKATTLAFIISCKGIMEMILFSVWRDEKMITGQQISLLIINVVIITIISTPIVVYLYDPSRRYRCYYKRTIQKSKQNYLRILICINKEENVSPVINLLEVSNPTRSSPVTAFVLQLFELKGSVTAFLKPHHRQIKYSAAASSPIVNAFNHFQRRCNGNVVVQHFTTIAPYATIHDDICTIALDKRTNFVILPFHKTWGVSGIVESDPSIRAINRNVLDKAPCSVGILVHRGKKGGNRPLLISESIYHILVLFIGGQDDREAIAYSSRMAEHPHVSLTVVRFLSMRDHPNTSIKKDLDNEVMDELRTSAVRKKIMYKEETVKDGMGTIEAIRKLKDTIDLFIVGKHHAPDSAATLGLTEWNECPELGIIGDMLLQSYDEFSVLVVQQ